MSIRIHHLATGILAAGSIVSAEPADNIPVAPIAPEAWRGMTNVFRLRNDQLNVVVAPGIGRIAHIGLGTNDNVLRIEAGASGDFANFGGDWLWPVAQARWPAFNGGRNWPPPALLEQRPWLGNAWKGADGSESCLMRNAFGPPLNIVVSRKVTVDKDSNRIRVDQRIERTGLSDIPVTLWNVSQVLGAQRAVLPVEDTFKTLGFDNPDKVVSLCESSVVFDAKSGTEHKLGSASPRAWIAAQRGNLVILEQVSSADAGGEFPDGGCRVEMYSNSGLGYTEIETLSAEKLLKPGEALANTVYIDVFEAPPDSDAADLANLVRSKAGEKTISPTREP